MDLIALILSVAAGVLLLFAGRKFFWLAAALVAFLFTYILFERFFGGGWLGLIVALLVGALFVWLAIKYIRVAGFIVGALAGSVALPLILNLFGIDWGWFLMAGLGALIGFLLMRFLFNWGLILLTSWAGASYVAERLEDQLSLGTAIATLLFVVLLAAGIFVQSRQIKE